MTAEVLSPKAPMADTEILYRAVLNEARFFPEDGQGGRRISSMAFNDVGRRPSVDRALLCPSGPSETQKRLNHFLGSAIIAPRSRRAARAYSGSFPILRR